VAAYWGTDFLTSVFTRSQSCRFIILCKQDSRILEHTVRIARDRKITVKNYTSFTLRILKFNLVYNCKMRYFLWKPLTARLLVAFGAGEQYHTCNKEYTVNTKMPNCNLPFRCMQAPAVMTMCSVNPYSCTQFLFMFLPF